MNTRLKTQDISGKNGRSQTLDAFIHGVKQILLKFSRETRPSASYHTNIYVYMETHTGPVILSRHDVQLCVYGPTERSEGCT